MSQKLPNFGLKNESCVKLFFLSERTHGAGTRCVFDPSTGPLSAPLPKCLSDTPPNPMDPRLPPPPPIKDSCRQTKTDLPASQSPPSRPCLHTAVLNLPVWARILQGIPGLDYSPFFYLGFVQNGVSLMRRRRSLVFS